MRLYCATHPKYRELHYLKSVKRRRLLKPRNDLGSVSEKRLTEIENRGLKAYDFNLWYFGVAHGETHHPILPNLPKGKRCNCGGKYVLAKNPLEYVCSKCGMVYS